MREADTLGVGTKLEYAFLIRRSLFAAALCLLPFLGACQQVTVDVASANTAEEISARADQAARQFARKLDLATLRARTELARAGHYHPQFPLSFPTTIWLARNGALLPAPGTGSGGAESPDEVRHGPFVARGTLGGGLTLVFDSSGSRAFPAAYQAKLQTIFADVQSTLNSAFGLPAVSGNVAVKDYNADISDRGFFSGGFYIPNTSPPEIHFPEYGDDASIAVNFIHVLLLAYLGPDQYGFDSFNEGLVRAATMQVARTPSALPGFDQSAIASVLENSYDVGPWYDWYNQRALGGASFVAANLATQPVNGVGGLWLLRYRMAGAAWQKMAVEHAGFISNFNAGFYANPGIASNVPSLITLAQNTLNSIAPSSPTIEGVTFAQWFQRQFILETKTTSGRKVLVQPVPITNNLLATDFGPFLIQANYFQTLTGGDEVLSGATSYPIFWEGDISLTRLFTTAQDETMTITGAFGSIAPNLPDVNSGVPYRATIDIPVADQLGRVYLPAGSIATGTNTTPNDFYGTVTGVFLQSGDSLRLQVTVGGASIPDVPVTDQGAFGTLIGTAAYLGNTTVTVNVVRHNTVGDNVVYSRTIDKGPGSLALDLRAATDVGFTNQNGLPKGISTMGFPVDPWISYNPDLVGATTLIARYDPSTGTYSLFPDAEPFKIGLGYFMRANSAVTPLTISGRIYANIAGTVSLRPGWNLIANPIAETTEVDHMLSVHAADFPRFFTDAEGSDIGTVFFEFQPGTNDAASGAPETGSMTPATQFEAGKAYFVRVLSPEGVTLVFEQQAGAGPPGRAQVAAAPRATTPNGWLMGVNLIDGRFKVGAQIGQSSTATAGFDPREDAELPPGLTGGRQVAATDIGWMYRDVRRLGLPEVFTLQFTGLKPGKTYTLGFEKVRNSPGVFGVYRASGPIIGYFAVGDQVPFTATSTTMTLKIRVNGGMGR